MLCLSIRPGSSVFIGDYEVKNIGPSTIKLAFNVPKDVRVVRSEIARRDELKEPKKAA